MSTNQIPRDEGMDNSLALLKEGYLFINDRMEKFQSDIFETRLMGQKVICMRGKEAAELFYDVDKFQRKWAIPNRIQETLLGKRGVQTLDGKQHLIRKHLFMSLMTPPHQKQLAEQIAEYWEREKKQWERKEKIILFEEAKKVLCKVACSWAGVPLLELEADSRADDFVSMVYAFGTIGPEHWKGRIARNRVEEWIEEIIENVRSGEIKAEQDSALYKMAFYKEADGQHFSTHLAAVELINVIRPIVAIATYITFSALALYEHPDQKEKLKNGDPAKGHRCPGEGITVEIMKATLDFLINKVDYAVPNQDLSYRLDRIPTLPKSGFVIRLS